ncbi:MAG: flagellar assembly peptidoglycan hydrolase FlgJ [Gammaproteobacteria bacterium]|nr:flagellar assembly peptidoglycan hydrolase FlgJ [Gammaproteobacteria bacterium]
MINNSANNQADFAFDLQGLNSLRTLSRKNKGAALDKTAQQFEGLFIQMMLKQARSSSLGDPLFGSNNMDFYQDMFDQQLALTMANKGETGIGDMLVKQLKGTMGIPEEEKQSDLQTSASESKELTPLRRFIGSPKPIHIPGQQISVANEQRSVVSEGARKQVEKIFESPESFVETLMPYAEKAAERLGVSAKVLLAQAALETGWGKHISRDSEGQASFNLFNIKADQRWSGKTLDMNTLEFVGGKFIKEQASFRAYDGYGESFEDYVDFLKTNPRYGDAVTQAKGDIAFTKALQGAGYATDPDYATKIAGVMNNAALAQAFSGLKFSAN